MARFEAGVQELFSEISEKPLDKETGEDYNGRNVADVRHVLRRGRIVA